MKPTEQEIIEQIAGRCEVAEAQVEQLQTKTIPFLMERLEEVEAERDETIACLQRVVEADRDDSRMGHPNAGDSCIGACIALDVMPWLDQRGKLLPFVARAALGEDA